MLFSIRGGKGTDDASEMVPAGDSSLEVIIGGCAKILEPVGCMVEFDVVMIVEEAERDSGDNCCGGLGV